MLSQTLGNMGPLKPQDGSLKPVRRGENIPTGLKGIQVAGRWFSSLFCKISPCCSAMLEKKTTPKSVSPDLYVVTVKKLKKIKINKLIFLLKQIPQMPIFT